MIYFHNFKKYFKLFYYNKFKILFNNSLSISITIDIINLLLTMIFYEH